MNADVTPIAADAKRRFLDRISYEILGAAQRVSTTLGCGFLEKVYENALVIELRRRDLAVEQQKPVLVQYEGHIVGDYVPDLIVSDEIVVEIKSVARLDQIHSQQCINYLRATNLPVCLLLNFARPRLDWKRLVWNF